MARHNYKILFTTVVLLTFINFMIINPAMAANNILNSLKNSGGAAGYNITEVESNADIFMQTTVGKIIGIALGFIGVLFLILIIYSGYQWMTAGGNEETVTKAKKRIAEAAIGLVIILAAWLLTFFILNNLFSAFEAQTT